MTMVPAENLSKQHHHHHHLFYSSTGYGGCGSCSSNYTESFGDDLMSRIQLQGYDHYCDNSSHHQACLGSDLVVVSTINNNNNNNPPMAEDESRTNSLNEAASSSKENYTNINNNSNHHQEERDDDEGWLQLRIGGHTISHEEIKHDQEDPMAARRGGGGSRLTELDLLPPGGGSSSTSQQQQQQQQYPKPCTLAASPFQYHHEFRPPRPPLMNIAGVGTTSLFFQHGSSSTFPAHHQEINWAFRPINPQHHHISMVPSSSSSSSSSSSANLMPFGFGSYFTRPNYHHHQMQTGADIAGPSSDFRIIDPPRRPHSGIWFMLLASQNQAKEPFLPQIPKSYLRIKDGRMTVRLLLKYLVNKLSLDSESEIEITCRGIQLLPSLTLQHVRDNIWSPKDAVTLLPESSTADHVMVLHYGRRTPA